MLRAVLPFTPLLLTAIASAQPRFAALRDLAPPSAAPYFVSALIDVDQDGAPDLLTFPTSSPGPVHLHRNDGSGRWLPARTTTASLDRQAIAVGDLDGDGDLDAVTALGDLLRNDRGTLVTLQGQVPGLSGGNIALGDFDGDGDPDLYCNNGLRQGFARNDGGNRFTAVTTGLPPTPFASDPAVADVNGDGVMDLVQGGGAFFGQRAQLFVWLGQRGGGFLDRTAAQPTPRTSILTFALADLDADGDVDAVVGYTDGLTELRLNDGTGRFLVAASGLPSIPERVEYIACADMDGDGDPDVVLGNARFSPDDHLVVLANNGQARFQRLPRGSARPGRAYRIDLADLDGDGDTDALLHTGFGQRVALNDGTGKLHEEATFPAQGLQVLDIATGDINGDRLPDLVFRDTRRADNVFRYDNLGDGTFTDVSSTLPAGLTSTSGLLLADLDQDGDSDLLVHGTQVGSGQSRLFRNDRGTFVDVTPQLGTQSRSNLPPQAADLDGDGDLDLVIGTYIYRNDGSWRFSRGPNLPSFAVAWVGLGDIDNDGDLDALTGIQDDPTRGPQPARLLRNDGNRFVDVSATLPQSLVRTNFALFADLDGDGRQDLVVNRLNTEVYWNDPNGFVAGPTYRNVKSRSTAADIDGNGSIELLFDGRILQSAGGRRLIETTPLAPALRFGRSAVADLDADGDTDLILYGFGGNPAIYSNVTAQLARSAPPRVGKPFQLELYGPPGAPAVLFASPSRLTTPIAIPGLGLLWLGSGLPLATTTIGTNGKFVWSTRALPGGPTTFLQAALLGTNPTLTNHERLVLRPW